MVKQMSCNAMVKAWCCDCEFERDGDYHVWLWEPLGVDDVPDDARPYCYGLGEIDFYDHSGNKLLLRSVRHHLFCGGIDVVLLSSGVFYEICSGQCVYRAGRWHMRWWAGNNTRRARMLNAGYPEYKS